MLLFMSRASILVANGEVCVCVGGQFVGLLVLGKHDALLTSTLVPVLLLIASLTVFGTFTVCSFTI